jgi:hypothetical protein
MRSGRRVVDAALVDAVFTTRRARAGAATDPAVRLRLTRAGAASRAGVAEYTSLVQRHRWRP